MATTITCDVCEGQIIFRPISVEVRNGEHPHSGSAMHKKIDVCDECIHKIPDLKSNVEYDEGPGALK